MIIVETSTSTTSAQKYVKFCCCVDDDFYVSLNKQNLKTPKQTLHKYDEDDEFE